MYFGRASQHSVRHQGPGSARTHMTQSFDFGLGLSWLAEVPQCWAGENRGPFSCQCWIILISDQVQLWIILISGCFALLICGCCPPPSWFEHPWLHWAAFAREAATTNWAAPAWSTAARSDRASKFHVKCGWQGKWQVGLPVMWLVLRAEGTCRYVWVVGADVPPQAFPMPKHRFWICTSRGRIC
jgi:hypothetical protein